MDGAVPRLASARLWPQTEHLKSALVRYERTGAQRARRRCGRPPTTPWRATFDAGRRGSWRDRWLAAGGWAPGPAPASSGYHIVCALEELIRVAAPASIA